MGIGKKIKEIRKQIKLTQQEFALRSGVGLRFVRDLEQGKKTVRLDKINQVLDFLGYHLEILKNENKLGWLAAKYGTDGEVQKIGDKK
ncbi:MAG: helix-turn-helix transcriptional regulator [Endomicrobiales bacterium]|nr:helix-turn-helix transcriptional regulator [Endomicrobiales bacterium]